MIAHGAEVASDHRVQQGHAVLYAGKNLLRAEQLASVTRFHACSPFLRSSHIRSHICLAPLVDGLPYLG